MIPICLYTLLKTFNTLNKPADKKSGDTLMEPLLPNKADGIVLSKQICPEQVATSDNSIQITFSGKRGEKGELVAKDGCKAIVVKAAFVNWMVGIYLYRDGKEVDYYDIFGVFDGSFN